MIRHLARQLPAPSRIISNFGITGLGFHGSRAPCYADLGQKKARRLIIPYVPCLAFLKTFSYMTCRPCGLAYQTVPQHGRREPVRPPLAVVDQAFVLVQAWPLGWRNTACRPFVKPRTRKVCQIIPFWNTFSTIGQIIPFWNTFSTIGQIIPFWNTMSVKD